MKNIILIVCILFATAASAQVLDTTVIHKSYEGLKMEEAIARLKSDYNLKIFYDPHWVDSLVVKSSSSGRTVKAFFDENLASTGIEAIEYYNNIILVVKNGAILEVNNTQNEELIVVGDGSASQNDIVTIKGEIQDGSTDEPLIGAQFVIKSLNVGAVTNLSGKYELKVPVGKYTAEVTFIGYEKKMLDVAVTSSGSLNVDLFSGSVQLDELVITAEAEDRNVQQSVAGVQKLGIETIKQLPTFLGEIDPVKSLTTLPGVSTAGELSSGFNVRGGESGQNLILQDGGTIYNPTHLFGFFSAFNPDLVKDVTLYKGGGPANFGGRISSILDIKLKNGDTEKYQLSGGIGVVSSRLTVEGPIIKDQSSFIVGARSSYSNWILHSIHDLEVANSSAKFYDMNGKVYQKIGTKDQLEASFYHSYDDFKLAADTTYSWSTKNYTAQWNHVFNDRLIGSLNLANSNYASKVTNPDGVEAFKYENKISNSTFKYELNYKIKSRNNLLFGIEANYNEIEPGQLKPLKEDANLLPVDLHDQRGLQAAAYLQNDFDLSSRSAFSVGLRYSRFYRLGKDHIYLFDDEPTSERAPSIIDSVDFKAGEVIKSFYGFEPRVSYRYLITPTTSIKLSYYRTYQYLHLISNTVSVTPQDYWIASGLHLQPQVGDQFALGYFRNFKNNTYELSAEGFYKQVDETVDFIEGADILLNMGLEAGIVQGNGYSYGVELLLKKSKGRLNGWIAYTYTRSLRKFDFGDSYKTISGGKLYPSNYDKPHDLSIVLNYKLGGRTVLSANFSYSSGRPITIPVSKFSYDKILSVLNYSDRHEYRIPDYHRLDLSLTIKESLKKKKFIRGEWVFSVFNVYGRKNAYSIFFDKTGLAHKLSILGTIFPSVSYNFKI